MKVTVKLVGRYKDIIGKESLEIDIQKGNTIWDVVDAFAQQYPEIERDKKFIMVAKSNRYTTFDEKIEDGDEITISPPVVSGG